AGALGRQWRVLRAGVVRAVRLLEGARRSGYGRGAEPVRARPRPRRLGRHRHTPARAAAGAAPRSLTLRMDLQRARSACAAHAVDRAVRDPRAAASGRPVAYVSARNATWTMSPI